MAMRRPEHLKNYTTTVSAEKTAFEIQTLLAGKGASSVFVQYENGKPIALSFEITINNFKMSFRLPCNVAGAYQAMCRMKDCQQRYKNETQAERTAWRNLLLWTEAQLAMVEMQQVEFAEVFMPYACIIGSSQTLFQQARGDFPRFFEAVSEPRQLNNSETKLLESGEVIN